MAQIPVINLPTNIDPLTHTFGKVTEVNIDAGNLINPNKTRSEVELETNEHRNLYKYSHFDYEAGEQKNRHYGSPFTKDTAYGKVVPFFHDGRLAKEAVDWLPQKLMEKSSKIDSQILDDFRDKNTHQLSQALDPYDLNLYEQFDPEILIGLFASKEKGDSSCWSESRVWLE